MQKLSFRRRLRRWAVAPVFLATTAAVFAGGFYLSVTVPDAESDDPRVKEAVLLVRPIGCHEPSAAKLSVRAEGLVDGQRKSLAVRLTPLGDEEGYAVRRQWPAEGVWVLTLTGEYRGHTSSVLADLAPNGTLQTGKNGKGLAVRVVPHRLSTAEIETAVREAARRQAQMTRAGR